MEQTGGADKPRSWLLSIIRRTRLLRSIAKRWQEASDRAGYSLQALTPDIAPARWMVVSRVIDVVWSGLLIVVVLWGGWAVAGYARANLGLADIPEALLAGCITFLRVVVLIALATLVWVPIGVYVGLRPRLAAAIQPLAQFLAAFPANVMFPVFVVVIAKFRLDPDIWLSPLIILGAQWYILFNVVAGAGAFPRDLRDAATLMGVRGPQWWRRVILPGIFPYYITGALTATGGAWNASIVAEVVTWGDTRLVATGLGAYIAKATESGDIPHVVLGIVVMAGFVISFNRLLWRRLFVYAERKLRFD